LKLYSISHLLEKYCPLDLFISLDYNSQKKEDNVLLWNGQLLIKDGVYNGANLSFNILFPYNYPNSEPIVSFVDSIFHPLIDPKTNKLDVKKIFSKWTPGKHSAIILLYKIKDIFMNPKYFLIMDSLNPEGGKLFCEDYIEFETKVQQDIKKINNKINEENVDNNLIEEFKNILKKEKISTNSKQDQLENYFLFKYKAI
jgi:ubiquitin-protein ligase